MEIAQLADKYQAMTRAHERGAEDGYLNLPSADDLRESKVELEIVQLAQDDLNRLADQHKLQNDENWNSIRALRADIPNELGHDIESFRTTVELKFGEVERELARLYSRVLARQQEYRFFKTLHRLDREADVPASHYVTVALLSFVMVLDGVANAYFFKDSNASALLGGFLFAFLISVANTALGFVAGLLPWRYLQHRNRLHCVWALPLLVFLFTTIALFNLAVGHYRELLLLDKDAPAEQVLGRLLAAPTGLHSVQTFILVAAGVGIAMFAAYKGYTFTDTYPRFGRRYKLRMRSEEEFEERLSSLQGEINRIAVAYQEAAKSQYQKASKAIQKSVAILDEASSRYESGMALSSGIQEACNAAIKAYRDANLRVRDTARYPAPAHFSNVAKLKLSSNGFEPKGLEIAKAELQALGAKIKAEYEGLVQQIPKEVRRILSEKVLNERLETLKKAAKRAQKDDEKAA